MIKENEGKMTKGGVPRMIPANEKNNDGGGQSEVAAAAKGIYPRSGGRAGGDCATQKR